MSPKFASKTTLHPTSHLICCFYCCSISFLKRVLYVLLSYLTCSVTSSSQINPLFLAHLTLCPFVIYSFKISLDHTNALGCVVFPWKVVSLPEATLRGKTLLPAAQSQSPDTVLTHTFKPENKDSIFTFSFLTLLCLPAPFFNAAGFTSQAFPALVIPAEYFCQLASAHLSCITATRS